jgi:DNA-binding NtrC family response regulator
MAEYRSSAIRVAAIIDDDPDMRLVMRVMLERIGATVDLEFGRAEDAIEILDPGERGVIILDHQLDGDLTGLAAAPILRRRVPGAQIILCSTINLALEARREPSIAAFVCKLRLTELPDAVRGAAADLASS